MQILRTLLIVGLFTALLGAFTGCQQESSIMFGSIWLDCINEPNEPNQPILKATGKAADTLAEQFAQNIRTAQGRLNEMVKYNAWLYTAFVAMMILGGFFWAFTGSRYGFIPIVIPFCGIVFITFWAEYAKPVTLVVGILLGLLIIWKAIEYHTERDNERKKNGNPK